MFSQFKKYLMLNVLSIYGFLIWSWWAWFWTAAFLGMIAYGLSGLAIPFLLGEQYLIAVLISILLLIEILIRKHNKKLDDKLNIKLPERVFYIGLILLFLPLFLVGMFIFLMPLW